MYTNTLTSISGDDLLVAPSYGNNLILEVSANNDIFFKKGEITKRFDNLVSDYLDMSFVREASFNSLNSQVEYILQEISGSSVLNFITSGISSDLLIKSYDGRDIVLEVSGNSEIIFKRGDISYNLDDLIGGGGGGFSQSSDYATYNILDITGKIIFTDTSNVQYYNDASLNNVDISGSLKVAGSISAPNIYTKTEIDNSFTNVYTKNQVYNKSEIDASLANVYTKNQVYTKTEIDASLANVYTKNQVYNKTEIDNSFTNVYTKNQVYNKSEIDASFTNVYTKNQVYTKTEIDASLANVYTKSLDVCGNVTFRGSTLYVPSLFTIDPNGHGDNTGTLLINGNLVVQGETTTINSSVVDISDKVLVLASNASNSLQADGAGFEISGAKVNLLYNNSSNTFRSSIGMSISGNVVPVSNGVGSLGETGKIWDIAYIRELNVTNFTNSIDGAKIASGTISSTQIANGSILTVDISDHAITYEKIAANAVTNTRIANGAVTHAKLSSDCIQSHNIVDGTIMDVDISANAAISGSKIANASITNDKINQANNWTFSQLTSTSANIHDVSVTNIEVSGNIAPLRDLSSNLGSSLKRWGIIYTNDLSINNINGQPYIGGGYTKIEIDVSFVSKQLFDASLSSIQLSNVYTKAEVDISFVSKELFETSYNFLLSSVGTSNESGDGGYFQNNDYASYDILNITDTIIFTDNSNNEINNDVSFNNVDISGALNVAGTISAPNIYTKSEIDLSFTNVYTKNQVYNKTEIDASFSNVYTRGQIDVSFVSKELFDASLSSIQVSNVYTKNEVDVSFVSKQLFETSYNVLLSSIGTGGGGGGGGGGGTSSIAKKFYNQDWNLLGTNITKVKDVSGNTPAVISASLDGYTIMVYWPYSTIFYPTGVGSQEQPRSSIAVYTFISNSWVQKGETFLLPFTYVPSWRYAESGGANGDQTGLATDNSISGKFMSGDGNTIAIPISRAGYGENTGEYLNTIYTDVVYSFNGTAWIEIASVTSQNSNRAGNTYFTFENNVIKRFLNGVGGSLTNVIIHTLTNGSFVQDSAQISESEVNTSINVPGSLDFWSRRTRAISADGKVVLFCKQNSMVLFKYNGTIWQQYGNVTLITLPTWSNYRGKLSHDGSVFLVSSIDSTVNGDTYAGRSKIYAYDSLSNTWIQRGQDIVYEEVQYIDEAQGIQYGSDTNLLSGDGLTVAFGGRNRPSVIYNNDGGTIYYNGYLQAYRYSSVNNYWSKIGREITGVTGERPGQYIASSYNGNVIHIDGQSFKETFTSVDTGRIRVYEIEV
jgi:hypothetical protein